MYEDARKWEHNKVSIIVLVFLFNTRSIPILIFYFAFGMFFSCPQLAKYSDS